MFYGDGVITPAISVLSAVEGLKVATPAFEPYVVPIALVLLVVLFSVQSRGTARVGRLFGPVMLVWFVTLAVLGHRPYRAEARGAAGAQPALRDRAVHRSIPVTSFVLLGAVVLAVTGAEALYTDMGHFGAHADPHRLAVAWFSRPCCSTISARAR